MWLALREIARSKGRFGLLSGAIGLLVFLILFQQALLNGLITDFVGAVENQNSPVLVFNDQARKNVEGSFLDLDQAEAIAAVSGVATTGLIGEGTFTVLAGDDDADAVLFGYELGGLGEPTSLVEGRLPEGPNEAVASEADAGAGFDIGDRVTIVADADAPVITVVGLASEARWSVAPTMFVSYETFESARLAVNPASQVVLPSLVAVAPEPGVSLDALTDAIDAAVPGTEALTNREATEENPGVAGTSQSFNIILTLGFIVVLIVVAFFFLILTVQKAKPLTLLRAIGSPRSFLVKNLAGQIVLVMGAGIAIGLALTFLVIAVAPSGDVSVAVQPSTAITTVVALFVLALLAGVASIRRVLRIDPIDATVDSSRSL